MNKARRFEITDSGTGETLEVLVQNGPEGLLIQPKGYGDHGSDDGKGFPILLDLHNGKLQLIVWSDINQEDSTHQIKLEEAKESNRAPF